MTWTNLHLAFLLIHRVDDLVLPHRLPSLIVTIGNVRAEDRYERSRRWTMYPVNFCPWIHTVRPPHCVLRSIMQPKRCHACMHAFNNKMGREEQLVTTITYTSSIISYNNNNCCCCIIQHNSLLNVRIFIPKRRTVPISAYGLPSTKSSIPHHIHRLIVTWFIM